MNDLISSILDVFLKIQYWIKHKRQRKHEKDNNLPKKIVWHPLTKPFLTFILIIIPISFVFFLCKSINKNKEKTIERMTEIAKLLDDENKQFGKFPSQLKDIVRNNPLRQNINLDYWRNKFVYNLSKDSLNYRLISLGKDKTINTTDDIIITSD